MQKPEANFSAHHPAYFPQIDIFRCVKQVDHFIFADDLQYTSHSQINRCLIRNDQGTQWLTVPVRTKSRQKQLVKDVRIVNETDWRKRHLKTLSMCYKNAAYFEKYIDFIESLYRKEWRFLVDLNLCGLEFIRQELGITTPVTVSSQLNLRTKATKRIIEIAQKIDCSVYSCDKIYKEYLDEQEFSEAKIELRFYRFEPRKYHQLQDVFIPGLSIIDLLFNEGDEARNFVF